MWSLIFHPTLCFLVIFETFMVHATVQSLECNVALHRPTEQSSTYNVSGIPVGYSCNAVDGNINTDYWHGSCSHTNDRTNGYWKVDFGEKYTVQRIEVYLRTDEISKKFYERFNHMTLTIDDVKCIEYVGPPTLDEINPFILYCDNVTKGRELMFVHKVREMIQLYEVQVYATLEGSLCPEPPQNWTCRNLTYTPNITLDITTPHVTPNEAQKANANKTKVVGTTNSPAEADFRHESSTQVEPSQKSTEQASTTQEIMLAQGSSSSDVNYDKCLCPCSNFRSSVSFNLTIDEVLEKMADIIQDIKVDKKQTKMAQNKLVCAKDDRPSSKTLGGVGVLIILLVVGFVIAMDINVIISCLQK